MGSKATEQEFPESFAEYRQEILERRLADPTFADMWSDYCEVLDSLAPITNRTTELERLKNELEDEITEALGIMPDAGDGCRDHTE